MKTFELRSLGDRGIAHYVVPLAVVTLVAVGGVYTLVASHADPITKSGPQLVLPVRRASTQSSIGHQQGQYWCATVQTAIYAKTSGKVDTVRLNFAGVSRSYPLLYRGNNTWGASLLPGNNIDFNGDSKITNRGIFSRLTCVAHKGASKNLGRITVTAVYGTQKASKSGSLGTLPSH